MPRDTGRNDRRSHIAYLVARLMAEDGIEDYALAKRKAARQAGMPDTRELPANEEIDEALRTYQQIYHAKEHQVRLRTLRETAARAMREFARFNPHLTGSVLNGNAGKYADINLQLFTDNEKQTYDRIQKVFQSQYNDVVDIYDSDFVNDPTGQAVIVVVKHALGLIQKPDPILTGTALRGSRLDNRGG